MADNDTDRKQRTDRFTRPLRTTGVYLMILGGLGCVAGLFELMGTEEGKWVAVPILAVMAGFGLWAANR